MIARREHHQLALLRELHRKPALAEVRTPAELIAFRASGESLLLTLADENGHRILRISTVDAPGLELLGADDRSTIRAALLSLHRAGGPPDGS